MKIAFADFIGWDYKVESVYHMVLGGSQSALCYLAEALTAQGNEVFLLNHTSVPGMSRGVMCLSLDTVPVQLVQSLDALIVLNFAGQGIQLRPLLGNKTRLVLWTQHAHDQPGVQALQNPAERDIYDGIALVSDWQRDRYHQHLGIDLARTRVLRNAIGPSFCELFPDDTSILAQKPKPPVLAYTSTPFRGLDILLEVFPKIRQALPGTRLKVFSSMRVYHHVFETDEESDYGSLYRQCRETEGAEYVGSIPQADLACELKSVVLLTYPNTFPETSCISVMEAMASGCWVVTSDLGALPETTAGFARLIPIEEGWEVYKDRFVEETVRVLRDCTANTKDVETRLRQQVTHVNSCCNWRVRAQEWVEWLGSFRAKTAKAIAVSSANLQQQAYNCFIQGEYTQATTLYEQAIEVCPSLMSNYWYLGLSFLLQDQEVEAQITWTLAIANGEPEQVDVWTTELIQVLQAEAGRREALADHQTARLIQHYITLV